MARLDLRLNDDTDRDTIAWLDAQHDKTAAVDLDAIRAVLETVLDERLVGVTLPGEQSTDPELESKLDGMF